MRLQKFMANSGVASRRKSEELILKGVVEVNGKTITELGYKVDPKKDRVLVNKKRVRPITEHTYVILNKPMGVVSTANDEKGRTSVVDLIDIEDKRLYPVGRLDIDTTGLVLLTDDGELANKYMHPRSNIEKKYIVTVEGVPNKQSLMKLRNGVFIRGRKTMPAKVKILKNYIDDSILEVIIREGRNHQIKNMFSIVGNPVKKLKRIEIGEISLGSLNPGEWRYLTEEELDSIR